METQREKITKKALEVLENNPSGVRYSDLRRQLSIILPDIPSNTIHGIIWDLDKKNDQIIKPERGLFVFKKYIDITERKTDISNNLQLPTEASFYQSFADYLKQDLEECTEVIPLGGNTFGDKWGTPDVLGVYKFSEVDAVRPPVEIISAEIKTDINQLITAFGQACAYKIFSHKVYLAVPKEADTGRIELLCLRLGIGLILFDKNDSHNPRWEIRTRAMKSEPDYFYVNEYLQKLGELRKSLF